MPFDIMLWQQTHFALIFSHIVRVLMTLALELLSKNMIIEQNSTDVLSANKMSAFK